MVLLLSFCHFFSYSLISASNVVVDISTRGQYISDAKSWFSSSEKLISTRDLFNGPPNPYNLSTFQEIDCDFIEPDLTDPLGGTTPKFRCAYLVGDKKIELKIKYDQQYNSVAERWGRPNEEVYASVVSQRILWALGFGSDQSVPLVVNCRNCPLEPW
jgi:hypothetical protein